MSGFLRTVGDIAKVGAGIVQGRNLDRQQGIRDALAQRQQQQDEQRNSVLNALTQAQTAKMLTPDVPDPEEFERFDDAEGLMFERGKNTGTVRPLTHNGNPLRVYRAPKPAEDLEPTIGKDGKPTLTPKSQAAGMTPYDKPSTASEPLVPIRSGDGAKYVTRSDAVGQEVPPSTQNRPPNEFASKAALVYDRAAESAKILGEFYDKGAEAGSLMGKLPLVGSYFTTADQQRMNTAAETVASAILRLESGAAITEGEIRSYAKQFLPVPGDSPEVRAQKKQTLQTQLERIKAAAAPAMGGGPGGGAAPPAFDPKAYLQKLRGGG